MKKYVRILPMFFLLCVFAFASCTTNSPDSSSENSTESMRSNDNTSMDESVSQTIPVTTMITSDVSETNSEVMTEGSADLTQQITEPSEITEPITDVTQTEPIADVSQTAQLSLEEEVAQLAGIKSFGTGMFLDPSDPYTFSPLVYTGGDFTFYYQITVGEFDAEYGLGFMLNGIYQDIRIEGNGISTSYNTMHTVQVPAGATKVFKIYLHPNIGHTGDVLKFTNASVVNPSAIITNAEDTYDNTQLHLSATLSSPFTMQSDSSNSVSVCQNFSGETHTSYNKNIKTSFREINNSGELCQILIGTDVSTMVTYNSRNRTLIADTKISVSRSAAAPLKVVLGGGKYGTTQRVSLYVNGKAVPVFDGKSYADITIDQTNQTELTVFLDTSSLSEWNNMYLLAYTMDDSTLVSPVSFVQSNVYVLRVEG